MMVLWPMFFLFYFSVIISSVVCLAIEFNLKGPKTMALFSFLLAFCLLYSADAGTNQSLNRNDFPQGFIFGTASSAYQVLSALVS